MSKTSRKIWMKRVLLSAVVIFIVTRVDYADAITIGPNARTFTFVNNLDNTVTDFEVELMNPLGGPGIGGGNGGAPFPGPVDRERPFPQGGFQRIIYNVGALGNGVAPGQMYTHSFPNWNEGVVFCVFFSISGRIRIVVELEPVKSEALNFCPNPLPGGLCPDGQTTAVPEPATMFLLGTGLAGVAIKTRKRLKNRKTVQGSQ